MPKVLAHLAHSRPISTSSSSVGSMLMAQSPMASTVLSPTPSRTIMKQEETILFSGLVLMSCRAGRTVSAVE